MEKENLTQSTLPEGADVTPTDGAEGAVEVSENQSEAEVTEEVLDNLTLKELNEFTGKTFTSKDAALKSIRDTFSYVGKKVNKLDGDAAQKVQELESKMFFMQNPDMQDMQPLLESLAKTNGVTLEEAAQLKEFTTVYDKVKGYNNQASTVMPSSNGVPKVDNYEKRLQEARGNPQAMATLLRERLAK